MAFEHDWEHDCDLHHVVMLDPDYARYAGLELQPLSYDAEQLEQAMNEVTSAPFTPRQVRQQYEFLADYLLADTDNMTYQELFDWVECMMEHIDTYFFRGGLTRGEESYLSLRLHEKLYPMAHGFCEHSIVPLHYRIFLFTADAQTGKRRPKVSLLTTLVHEMLHAYLSAFFNFCPVKGQIELVNENGGHGVLFWVMYRSMYTHMQTWHPALAKLNLEPPRLLPEPLVRAYYGVARKLPWLRNEWDVMDLADDQPTLFPPLLWKIEQKEEFIRCGLRLSAATYEQFIENRVPYPAGFYNCLCRGIFLAILFILAGFSLLWWLLAIHCHVLALSAGSK
ncbi:hypothetical protein HD806DRAFT_552860 [Xylariaceae sp. AK1471]|nr:hypothetical protein HD806DRAFT_552860 [Xylariaceae sp. AK1471]